MIKHAKLEPGTTPSQVSGKPATKIEDGVPLADGEQVPEATVEKAASALNEDRAGKAAQA